MPVSKRNNADRQYDIIMLIPADNMDGIIAHALSNDHGRV
jgi:hypothetical protein